MSRENIEQFYQEVQEDTSLQEQIAAATDRNSLVDLAIQLASEKGLNFNAEELNQFLDEKGIYLAQGNEELSDEQLEAVVGGKGLQAAVQTPIGGGGLVIDV